MYAADDKIDLELKWKKNPEHKRPKKEKDDGASDLDDKDDGGVEGEEVKDTVDRVKK